MVCQGWGGVEGVRRRDTAGGSGEEGEGGEEGVGGAGGEGVVEGAANCLAGVVGWFWRVGFFFAFLEGMGVYSELNLNCSVYGRVIIYESSDYS